VWKESLQLEEEEMRSMWLWSLTHAANIFLGDQDSPGRKNAVAFIFSEDLSVY